MSVLVVGSTAYDTIHTPFAGPKECLGGSATHFALSARWFNEVRLVSVVGEDFKDSDVQMLKDQGIKTEGLEIAKGKTFRWTGKYSSDMNHRETLSVDLNTFGDFDPKLPEAWRSSPFVFLANGHPLVQAKVLEQVSGPKFVVADTMDLWIHTAKDELLALMQKLDGIVLNDEEAKLLTGEHNLIKAGRALLRMGPSIAVVKKGEHGSFLFSQFFQFALPAYPTENVLDPTGAGDSFAGGFMGYLSQLESISVWSLKKAVAYGTCTASLNVESYGTERVVNADRSELEARYQEFLQFAQI
ncbi:MAG: sugar kinase [Planctomycetota bacterium]|nr:MAG: sugar kinase [Planctomycetota bacterium]